MRQLAQRVSYIWIDMQWERNKLTSYVSAGGVMGFPPAKGADAVPPGVRFPPYAKDTETIVARIAADEIGYVSALVESYEGIGIVRTRDPKFGIIEFWVIPEFREAFQALLEDLRSEMEIEILDIPPASRL